MSGDNDTPQFSREISHIVLLMHQVRHENEDEIFQILMAISPQIGELLPLDYETLGEPPKSSRSDVKNAHEVQDCMKEIASTLMSKFVTKLREIFSSRMLFESPERNLSLQSEAHVNAVQSVSHCMEQLQVLIGDEAAEKKLKVVVSRCMDMLLQKHLSCLPDSETNLKLCTEEFISLAKDVRLLISNVFSILMTSSLVPDHKHQIVIVQDTILEKLSLELLTLADIVKKALDKLQSRVSNGENESPTSSGVGFENRVQIADIVTGMAKIVNTYITIEDDIHSSEQLEITHLCTKLRQKKGVLKRNFDLPDLIQSSQHTAVKNSDNVTAGWDWIEMLRDLAPSLCVCLVEILKETHKNLLQETKDLFSRGHKPILVTSTSQSKLSLPSAPKLSLKCVGRILDLVLTWHPLYVVGGRKQSVSSLQSESVDTVNQIFKEIRSFILSKIDEVPEKCPANSLSALLSTVQDVCLVMQDCSRKIQSSKSHFVCTIQLFEALSDHILQLIIQYHKSKLSTAILHDGDSHYWADPRAYYEGERCSVSIVMWKAHLETLKADLLQHVSSETTNQILLEILNDSLTVLTNRYCMCEASFNRKPQVILDGSAILSCVFELLWTTAPVASCFLTTTPSAQSNLLRKIFTCCSDLFLCLNLTALPVQQLANEVGSSIQNLNSIQRPFFHWLSSLNATIFPFGWNGDMNKLPPGCLIVCLLSYICSDKQIKHEYILQCFSSHNFYLVHMLASGKLLNSDVLLADVQTHLINIFSDTPACISSILMTCALSNPNFTQSTFLNMHQEPENNSTAWQSYVSKSVSPHIHQSVFNCVNFITSNTWSPVARHIVRSLPDSLKSFVPDLETKSKKLVLYSCIASVMQGLRIAALNLDVGLRLFFIEIDRILHEDGSENTLTCDCFAAHYFLHLAHAVMRNHGKLQSLYGIDITLEAATFVTEVGESLLSIEQLEIASKNHPGQCIPLNEEISAFRATFLRLFSHTNSDEANMFEESMDVKAICQDFEKKKLISKIHKLLCINFQAISLQLLGGDETDQAPPPLFSDINLDMDKISHLSLPSCLQHNSMDKISYLVRHRPDMRENAYLNEEERHCVQLVKEHFNI
ncbi:uncharacterized protein LOC104265628 [Ciona intestinalis]